MTIDGGASTGTGTSSIVFNTAPAGSSGSTSNASSTVGTFTGAGALNLAIVGAGLQLNGNNGISFTTIGTSLLLGDSTTGASIAIGAGALQYETAAGSAHFDNTVIGYEAMAGVMTTSAADDVAVGYDALNANISGEYSTAIGYEALYQSPSGNDNTAVGYISINNGSISASDNTGIGYGSCAGGGSSVGIGDSALTLSGTLTGINNNAIGYQALYTLPNGSSYNEAIGRTALTGLTTGYSNIAIGDETMRATTSAAYDTAVGNSALYDNTTGIYNTAVGVSSLFSGTGASNNTGAGADASYSNTTGSGNAALGHDTAYNLTNGTGNVSVGNEALYSVSGSGTGVSNNVAVGDLALYELESTSTGNTALGYEAGDAGTILTTATGDTLIGYEAQANATTYANGTALGNSAVLTASNSLVLGDSSITNIYTKVTSITGISDRRLKKNIEPLDSAFGLDFVEKLKPVFYRFNNGDETQRYGFIAQDLEEALPKELADTVETAEPEHGLALIERQNDKNRTYRVTYGELFAPIVKAIQQEQQEIEAIKASDDAMQKDISALQAVAH